MRLIEEGADAILSIHDMVQRAIFKPNERMLALCQPFSLPILLMQKR
jgi:hypothetical protein